MNSEFDAYMLSEESSEPEVEQNEPSVETSETDVQPTEQTQPESTSTEPTATETKTEEQTEVSKQETTEQKAVTQAELLEAIKLMHQHQTQSQVQQQQAQPTQPQVTREDLQKYLQKPQLTAADMRVFAEGSPEEQLAFFSDFAEKITAYNLRVAQLVQRAEMMKEVAPLRQQQERYEAARQQQEMARVENDFYTQNPSLKDYKTLVKSIADQEIATNRQALAAMTEKQSCDYIASKAEALIKTFNPNFSLKATPSVVVAANPSVPQMAKHTSTERSQSAKKLNTPTSGEFDIYK